MLYRDFEKDYPKKNRFTQAQIDKSNLESGENDFSKLPRLYIICITNYDPFGYDRVLYTIKNQCVEEPELVYNDEVAIFYFNTMGTKGGTKSLKSFLKYLEESKDSNAIDDATSEVKSCVGTIKKNYVIGERYMTLGNLMDKIAAEAAAEATAEVTAEMGAIIAQKEATIAQKDAEIADLHSFRYRFLAEVTTSVPSPETTRLSRLMIPRSDECYRNTSLKI